MWNEMKGSLLNQSKLKQPIIWQDMNKGDLRP